MSTITAIYLGELRSEILHGPSGVRVPIDLPHALGGAAAAPSPTDLLAGALGACLLSTLGLIAKRRSWDLAGTRAEVVKETDDRVNRITALRTTIHVPGGDRFSQADRTKLERATDACTVHHGLHPDIDAPVTFVWE